MEYVTGVRKKDTMEISELLELGKPGETVKVNGLFIRFEIWELWHLSS